MLDSELKNLVIGKEIKDIEFKYGMSAHCNFLKSIVFTDGTKLSLCVVPSSDFVGCKIEEKVPGIFNESEFLIMVRGEINDS